MGKPYRTNFYNFLLKRQEEQTLGSKTFQYQEEKRTIVIPLVAASETGSAQTQPQNVDSLRRMYILGMGVIRLRRTFSWMELQNAEIEEHSGKSDATG